MKSGFSFDYGRLEIFFSRIFPSLSRLLLGFHYTNRRRIHTEFKNVKTANDNDKGYLAILIRNKAVLEIGRLKSHELKDNLIK